MSPPPICLGIKSEIKLSAAEKKQAFLFSSPTLRGVQLPSKSHVPVPGWMLASSFLAQLVQGVGVRGCTDVRR